MPLFLDGSKSGAFFLVGARVVCFLGGSKSGASFEREQEF